MTRYVFTARQLNALSEEEYFQLRDIPDLEVEIADWRSGIPDDVAEAWYDVANNWLLDDSYATLKHGFTGFLDRSDFDIYCDLRAGIGVEGLMEMFPGEDQERLVELYVGRLDATWYVADVYVPAFLDRDTAVELAMDTLEQMLENEEVVFIGLYCFWTDEMMANGA